MLVEAIYPGEKRAFSRDGASAPILVRDLIVTCRLTETAFILQLVVSIHPLRSDAKAAKVCEQ